MPELAEVEYGRKIAERLLAGRVIRDVWCDDSDTIVYDGVAPSDVAEALLGATVIAVHRHGKQLWFELDRRPWPLFHFGMTGAFRTTEDRALELASSPKGGDLEWPPRFAKIRLDTDGGRSLVMTNKRRLGRIRLRHEPTREPPISNLGFDPLLSLPDEPEFVARLRRRKGVVKGVLLNQKFAAGVGNWLADEILYQAGIAPTRRANELSGSEAARIREAMSTIVNRAVSVDADKARFPATWLFHHRWGKATEARTAKGEDIEFIDVAGRTTAWVPSAQR